jgi:hypothetical protein
VPLVATGLPLIAPFPMGMDDGRCNNAAVETCDGAGNCKESNGETCTENIQCASGVCEADDMCL